MRYWPVSLLTLLRTFSLRTGLEASTVTPGSTAPDVSFTTPVIDAWAKAVAGNNATRHRHITTHPGNARFIIPPEDWPMGFRRGGCYAGKGRLRNPQERLDENLAGDGDPATSFARSFENICDRPMGEHGIGMVLQRRVIALRVGRAVFVRGDVGARLRDDPVDVDLGAFQRIDLEALVDPHNQLRHRPQPGKLRVGDDGVEQLGRRRAPVETLVGGALPLEQRLVQMQQRTAKVNQQPAVGVLHVSDSSSIARNNSCAENGLCRTGPRPLRSADGARCASPVMKRILID